MGLPAAPTDFRLEAPEMPAAARSACHWFESSRVHHACGMPLRKAQVELLRYLTDARDHALGADLALWIEARSRFADYLTANRDKIRKKLRTATGASAAGVRAELEVAYLLLAERAFELAPEAFGAGKAGPDLTVTYRVNLRFNLEITRITPERAALPSRLAAAIGAKLRQLPSGMANILVIAVPSPASEGDIAAAIGVLRTEASPAVVAQYRRLSAVCVIDVLGVGAAYWTNREARHTVPAPAERSLRRCLGAPDTLRSA